MRAAVGSAALRNTAAAAGLGMAIVAALTVRHWFSVQFPASLADATSCGAAASFFSCLDSANAPVAAPLGIPIGVYGLLVGGLLLLAALFPSAEFERFARRVSGLNLVLAAGLSAYSIVVLRSLCPLCFSYTGLSLVHFALVMVMRRQAGDAWAPLRPATAGIRYLVVFGVVTILAGWSVSVHREAKVAATSGSEADRLAARFMALEPVREPSFISPYMAIQSTPRFGDAPVRMVVYGDFLCSDCRFLAEQVHRLEQEFPGRLNVAFQFFPLEAKCNDVVDKDKFPGACDLAYAAAYRPERFRAIHDELFAAGPAARSASWQREFIRRHDAEAALTDPATRDVVHRMIATGAEYEKTSEQYAHGIRSTPTTIVNGRMLIGTLPYEHLRAIVQALLAESGATSRYLENWQ